MVFVKVRHADGRKAEITEGEIAFYRSMGFEPVEGSTVEGDPGVMASAANDQPPAAVTGVEMRLDAIHAELRAIRDFLTPAALEPADDQTVELREPGGPASDATANDDPIESTQPSLDWTRKDLDDHAAALSVQAAETLPNKQAVLDAIRDATPSPPS